MYMLHAWDGDTFKPVTESAHVSEVLTSAPWPGLKSASYRLVGVWDRWFMNSEEVLESYHRGEASKELCDKIFERLIRLIISRDERVRALVSKYLKLENLIYIWKRMIGTGMIGGKSVGMLLSRAILEASNPKWKELLEAHDSFFIGSDVFYSFLVLNDCWWDRQKQKDPETFLDGLEETRMRILRGKFPDYIMRRFTDLLDYFGQSPIIVRSSSFLEDNFANAFAGKYESVFCANQGTHDERMEEFISAIRKIYASTMSEEALTYRAKRGVLDRDEQMALLVQRVSGAPHGRYFYPQVAGVGFSFNPYVWNARIDPKAGMIRLVFGLGTRAVDRYDDDYTRVVALNAAEMRPEENFDMVRKYAQRKVDVLNLEQRTHETRYFVDVAKYADNIPMSLFMTRDEKLDEWSESGTRGDFYAGALTFNKFLKETNFVDDMREMLAIIQEAYGCAADIEFTADVLADGRYKIDLLQCRPFLVRGTDVNALPPVDIKQEDLVMEAYGAVIGESRLTPLDRLVYVVPSEYGKLPNQDRYSIAKLIGRITHIPGEKAAHSMMVLGPGRWGTSTPSLGVPVSFRDINTVSAVCEIVGIRDDLVPDVSLGTHFFSDLIEMDILYTAYFPKKSGNYFNTEFFMSSPNRLKDLLPEESRWENVVRVIDIEQLQGKRVKMHADTMNQKCTVFLENA